MLKTVRILCSSGLLFLLIAGSLPAAGPELLVPVATLPAPEIQAALDEALYDYQVFQVDLKAADRQVRQHGRLSIFLGNQRLDLVLEENDLRSKDFRRVLMTDDGEIELPRGPVVTFKGHVLGREDSHVRMTVTEDLLNGTLFLGGETVYLDPVVDFAGELTAKLRRDSEGEIVVYSDKDVRAHEIGECAVEGHAELHPETPMGPRIELFESLSAEAKSHQFRTLEVATDCDGQYTQRFGANGADNRIAGILNSVEGVIYESELNLGINHVFEQCWSSIPNDPYTSLNASTTLNQLRSWWNANRRNVSRDVVHQFSAKNFSGSTIGIAFVGVICTSPGSAYGISQDVSGSRSRRRLTAHEIGHNLSANHDGGGAGCNGNGPIMCPSIQSGSSSQADDFSNQSFNSIDNHIDRRGGCI